MPTQAEVAQDNKEVVETDKAINALIENGTVQYWGILARLLMAKYLRRLAIAVEESDPRIRGDVQ